MAYIERAILTHLLSKIQPNKVIVILGARRVGKTFLLKKVTDSLNEPILFLNGEDYTTEEILRGKSIEQYKSLIGNHSILVIDEAQKIKDIGRILKLLVDEIEGLKIIATGSSAFDLNYSLGEPLTGRKYTYYLFPFAQCELMQNENLLLTKSNIEERLILGSYPELVNLNDQNEKIRYLTELVNAYLLKDILMLDNIKNASKILNILRLLAFQIGMEVSVNEIARQIGMDSKTVDKYLDLLTKVYVVFKIEGFSRNLRKEISKSSRYYFWDNGIRNHLVANFNTLSLRNDIGQLWENYIISERMKWQSYNGMVVNNYFWRTYDKQEIDWVEEREGNLFAFEIKYSKSTLKVPSGWKNAYPSSEFNVINSENYLSFIT
jgi:hypothetical protein